MNPEHDIVVAVFLTHAEAEQTVKELQTSGFDMTKLSIVAKNPHAEEHVAGFYTTGDRIRHWGKTGAFWGTLWGILAGAAFFVVPGLGPILVGGPLVAGIVTALEGAVLVGGLSAIGAGLYSVGVPESSILQYEIALKTDKYLLIAHGTGEEAVRAKRIIKEAHPAELHLHSPRDAERVNQAEFASL